MEESMSHTGNMPWDNLIDVSGYKESVAKRTVLSYRICTHDYCPLEVTGGIFCKHCGGMILKND